jgi:hypothetical protein
MRFEYYRGSQDTHSHLSHIVSLDHGTAVGVTHYDGSPGGEEEHPGGWAHFVNAVQYGYDIFVTVSLQVFPEGGIFSGLNRDNGHAGLIMWAHGAGVYHLISWHLAFGPTKTFLWLLPVPGAYEFWSEYAGDSSPFLESQKQEVWLYSNKIDHGKASSIQSAIEAYQNGKDQMEFARYSNKFGMLDYSKNYLTCVKAVDTVLTRARVVGFSFFDVPAIMSPYNYSLFLCTWDTSVYRNAAHVHLFENNGARRVDPE